MMGTQEISHATPIIFQLGTRSASSRHQNRNARPTRFFTGLDPLLSLGAPSLSSKKECKAWESFSRGPPAALLRRQCQQWGNKSPLQRRRLAIEGRQSTSTKKGGQPGPAKEGEQRRRLLNGASPEPLFPPDPPAHLFPPPVLTKANTEGSLHFQLVFQMK